MAFGHSVELRAQAALKLAPAFSDHMVLQRDQPIVIHGTAPAGEKVAVSFSGKTQSAAADDGGKWKVVFSAKRSGGPLQVRVSSGGNELLVNDVLIGDVWLCSGQSNMDFALKNAVGGKDEVAAGHFSPNIRLLKYASTAPGGNVAWDPAMLEKVNRSEVYRGEWKTADAASVAAFSAVGYYFGKQIVAETGVPIGLIQVALGGSPTESWIDSATLAQDGRFAGMLHDWRHSPQVMEWVKQRGGENTLRATSPTQRHTFMPGYNFKAGIAPFTAFPVKGVIWYQGESNVHDVALHAALFEKLVTSWRKHWNAALPFYFVQLSSIDRPHWPEFRDSQRQLALRIAGTGMAVSHDLGDSLDVHPTRKMEIGVRLAKLALHDVYGKKITASGPVLRKAYRDGQSIMLHFGSARALRTLDDKPLQGFELLTTDGRRFAADAAIHRKTISITVPPNLKVTSVLYAYQPFSRANLCNEARLPASTFSISIPKSDL